jgi:tetratricopeptide (TPR) repeat protein
MLLAAGLVACGTPRPAPSPEASEPRAPKASEASGALGSKGVNAPIAAAGALTGWEREIVDALLDGSLELARDLTEARMCMEHIAEAKALLAGEGSGEALVVLEEALARAPGQQEVLLLYAEASLRVGVELGERLHIEEALRAFALAGEGCEARLGSSRAARILGNNAEALRFARDGFARLDNVDPDWSWGEDPRRTLAEAAFNAWWGQRHGDSQQARALFDETEDALSRLMTERSEDVWAWNRLSTLYLEVERFDDAREAASRGLDRKPKDEALANLLARAAKAGGGGEGLTRAFGDFRRQHPEAPLAYWYPAREALERVLEGEDDNPIHTLQKAQRRFRQCRKADERYSADCKRFEVLCRAAEGWHFYDAGKFEKARAAFESMDELVDGGIRLELEGRGSGIVGLVLVADAQQKAGNLAEAAQIFDALRGFEPTNADFANNAGYFNREAGTELERTAKLMEDAARGEPLDKERLKRLREQAKVDKQDRGSDKEKARFTSQAYKLRALSLEAFGRSYAAYQAALELSPENMPLINDAAVVLVYHLGEHLDLAERELLRCVELGELQREDPGLSEDERFDLDIAWGDAHENLGYLHLNHRGDPRKAIAYFERSIEIGPAPRPNVEEELLPEARRMLAGGATPIESASERKKPK